MFGCPATCLKKQWRALSPQLVVGGWSGAPDVCVLSASGEEDSFDAPPPVLPAPMGFWDEAWNPDPCCFHFWTILVDPS